MTQPPEPVNTDRDLSQPASADDRAAAAEQFVHGLLGTRYRDRPIDRERRISAVLSRLQADEPAPARRRIRPWRIASGLAAAVLAVTGLVLLGLPAPTSAEAMIQASVAAAKTAGPRRYEVRIMPPRATELDPDPIATLDIKDAEHVLIRARSPFGDRVVVGRNVIGAWAIRPNGTIDRYPPRHAWPRWVDFGQSTIMLESVDELLASLKDSHTLTRGDAAPLPGTAAPRLGRVTAVRTGDGPPGPRRLELWIDQDSHIIRRMEVYFDPAPESAPGVAPPDRRPGMGPRPDRPPPPEGRRPPPPGGPRPDGPPPPRGERRPPPPELLGGAPDFKAGRHPPPPKMLVFQLVEGAEFPDHWFEPMTHERE